MRLAKTVPVVDIFKGKWFDPAFEDQIAFRVVVPADPGSRRISLSEPGAILIHLGPKRAKSWPESGLAVRVDSKGRVRCPVVGKCS